MLGALLGIGGLIGRVAGGAGKSASDQRMSENQLRLQQGQLQQHAHNTRQQAILQALLGGSNEATSRYNTRQSATTTALGQEEQGKLNRAQLGLQAPTVRARQSVMGSLMKNLQPVQIEARGGVAGRVPTITGGLTPAALDATTRQHGDELMKAALLAQLSGSDIPGATDFRSGILDAPAATDFRSGVLDAPKMPDLKQSGKLEKILGTIALIGSGMGAAGAAMGARGGGARGGEYPIDPVGGG